MIKKISSENFITTISIKDTVIIVFGAEWCGPCKTLYPLLESILEAGNNVFKIDADESKNIFKEYNVKNLPTIIIFKNGIEYKRIVGLTTKDKILNVLNENN